VEAMRCGALMRSKLRSAMERIFLFAFVILETPAGLWRGEKGWRVGRRLITVVVAATLFGDAGTVLGVPARQIIFTVFRPII
jgi:hypothetical protein